ncbi:hypothetical protein [Nocardioides jejuensis]|uniref:Acetone carboxylase n=1 Tax=Nocardioides jejuensis TaxID=2502782 RepID=A0A4R1CIV7_9ACTN|nr:hypothetical protein [Nocardioides jejuensis]TCJ30737.1 hypothetical protein EPD65_01490 [Nocardioides jejuensis]
MDTHDPALTCSSKGCTADAVWALRWNNPKIHTSDRRKAWLACAEHLASLTDFLTARNFLRETEAIADFVPDEGPQA